MLIILIKLHLYIGGNADYELLIYIKIKVV